MIGTISTSLTLVPFAFFIQMQMVIASFTCQHMKGSESHFLFRLHIVIELLFNIDYYMNFTNGCISKYAGYVNVHSTANGAWRLRNVLCDAIVALGCESRAWSGL